jgi:hypothetical protein
MRDSRHLRSYEPVTRMPAIHAADLVGCRPGVDPLLFIFSPSLTTLIGSSRCTDGALSRSRVSNPNSWLSI